MFGKWLDSDTMTPNIYKMAKKFGKSPPFCSFHYNIYIYIYFYCIYFHLETVIVPIFAVVFTLAYISISSLCYFNILD